jgi:hypothetical protein
MTIWADLETEYQEPAWPELTPAMMDMWISGLRSGIEIVAVSGNTSCGQTCGVCDAACTATGVHSVHTYNCGHQEHD